MIIDFTGTFFFFVVVVIRMVGASSISSGWYNDNDDEKKLKRILQQDIVAKTMINPFRFFGRAVAVVIIPTAAGDGDWWRLLLLVSAVWFIVGLLGVVRCWGGVRLGSRFVASFHCEMFLFLQPQTNNKSSKWRHSSNLFVTSFLPSLSVFGPLLHSHSHSFLFFSDFCLINSVRSTDFKLAERYRRSNNIGNGGTVLYYYCWTKRRRRVE